MSELPHDATDANQPTAAPVPGDGVLAAAPLIVVPAAPTLRPYQVESRDWIMRRKRGILALDMGLGKTPTTLDALRRLNPGTTLIAPCVKVAVGVWENEIPIWWPEVAGRVFVWMGDPRERATIWRDFMDAAEPKVMITNAHKIEFLLHIADSRLAAGYQDAAARARKASPPKPVPAPPDPGFPLSAADRRQARTWDAVVVDEAHFLRNKGTQLYRNAAQLRSGCAFLLTGSPVVKNAGDLWTLLHLVAPDQHEFRAYWPFVNKWCTVEFDGYGRKVGGPKNAPALRRLIAPYLLRKRKDDVLTELPPKIRQAISVPLYPQQRALYDAIAEEMLAELPPDPDTGELRLVMTPYKVAQIVRLRQTIINPALYGGPDVSAHLDALEELIGLEFDSGNHVAVFTPFVQAMPHIAKRLDRAGAKAIVEIKGGMTAQALTSTIRQFQTSTAPNRAIICSIMAGSAWTGTAASAAYFVGFDWVPANNVQSEDRLHRIGQRDTVRVGYLRAPYTVEDGMIDVLNERTTWEALALDPQRLLRGYEPAARPDRTDLRTAWSAQ